MAKERRLSKETFLRMAELAGRPFDEETELRTAHTYEQATPWRQKHPTT